MICNAGTDIIKPAEQYEENEWDKILDINLRGYYFCAQFAAQHTLSVGSGSIIMTSSIAGSAGIPGLVPYAASKGGINQLVGFGANTATLKRSEPCLCKSTEMVLPSFG